MKKYFKIGEISKLYNIGVDSLRYYEEIGIISPKRSDSGYRLYSVHDMWKLNVIRDLRELEFSMDQIKEYLTYHNTQSTLNMLEQEKKAITSKLEYLKKLQNNVEKRIQNIQQVNELPLNEIRIIEYPERRYYSTQNGYSNDYEMDILIKSLINMDKENLYIIGNNQIGTIIPTIKQDSSTLEYKSVFIIDDTGDRIFPKGKYLSVCYRGLYERSNKLTEQLISYAKIHNLKISDYFLELLWIDIHTSSDVNEYVTELQILIEE